jgi:hypothetical protein
MVNHLGQFIHQDNIGNNESRYSLSLQWLHKLNEIKLLHDYVELYCLENIIEIHFSFYNMQIIEADILRSQNQDGEIGVW